ncbi:MAG: restriction endonuclease subunit S [Alphaproteobacteria bacterium]|nr:restriction endonuclease subunit S [Alphaproteobacteria bacterium]
MQNWETVKLGDISEVIGGGTPSTKNYDFWDGKIPWLTPKDLSGYKNRYISRGERNISEKGLQNSSARMLPKGTVLLTSRAPIGYLAIAENAVCTNQGFKSLVLKDNYLPEFFYYLLKNNIEYIIGMSSGSTFAEISGKQVKALEFRVPPLPIQKKIAAVLSALDDKIELNNKINQNLEQQAQAIFKSWFVKQTNPERKKIKAEEFFDISIGKTPPRKEPEWFSSNSDDVIWISITDMGNCGTYISSSSEKIKSTAISKFNIRIVPNNTVILSFKLTVGRVAITDGKVTTNEAIAHFVTNKKEITEYLYCYLKNFNFQTMGSTSSIATAVNSKLIKAMPFVIPTEKELREFHELVSPMFFKIKIIQRETTRLAQLRDALLPKLMSGKIDVSKVDISDNQISFSSNEV